MDILDDMGVSKLSGESFLKVNYSFKLEYFILIESETLCSQSVDNL